MVAILVVAAATGLLIHSRMGAVAIVEASSRGSVAEVDRLLSRGVSANSSYRDLQGLGVGEPIITKEVPLLAAATNGHVATIALLLDHGANIDARNEWGETSLMLACRGDHLEVVAELLRRGADTRLRCDRGRTALMWASGYASAPVVERLMTHKAPRGFDTLGMTPNDLAGLRRESDRESIVRALDLEDPK